jgi:hypothetical protein
MSGRFGSVGPTIFDSSSDSSLGAATCEASSVAGSKTVVRKDVGVRLPLSAPKFRIRNDQISLSVASLGLGFGGRLTAVLTAVRRMNQEHCRRARPGWLEPTRELDQHGHAPCADGPLAWGSHGWRWLRGDACSARFRYSWMPLLLLMLAIASQIGDRGDRADGRDRRRDAALR